MLSFPFPLQPMPRTDDGKIASPADTKPVAADVASRNRADSSPATTRPTESPFVAPTELARAS